MKKLFGQLLLLSILCASCNKDSAKNAEEITAENLPVTTPVISPVIPPVAPPVIPPVTSPVKPEPQIGALNPNAGKVSLWDRSVGHDSAVFLPADYGKYPDRQYPMILSLHGLKGTVLNTAHTAVGGNRTGFIKQVWGTALAKTYPAIVIAPHWAEVGSTASGLWVHSQLRELILEAKKKYNVDPERIVVTGLSAGSIGTQDLIRNSKDLIAAAMPGAYASQFNNDPCKLADLPVWVFGNNSDSYFKSSGWEILEPKVGSCSNSAHEFKLTVYNSTCGHGCWDAHWAKPEVQEWLINQRKM